MSPPLKVYSHIVYYIAHLEIFVLSCMMVLCTLHQTNPFCCSVGHSFFYTANGFRHLSVIILDNNHSLFSDYRNFSVSIVDRNNILL